MRTFYLLRDEKANISMDFLTAVAVIIIAFVFAVSVLSSIITPYSGYSKELYPTADRAVTLLVEDEGYWESEDGEGTDWEDVWNGQNYSDVEKIGFLSSRSDKEKTLNGYKIFPLMHPISDIDGTWEYPVSSTPDLERENASRAIGLGRYNYYLQIRPLDENFYNITVADQRATEAVGDRGDVVSVVRYSILNYKIFEDFDGGSLYGSIKQKKVLFIIGYEDFDIIKSSGMLKFSITNWNVIENNGNILNIEISDEIKNNATQFGELLTGEYFDMWKNNESFFIKNTSPSISMSIQNSTDCVTIEIPEQTFNEKLPGWENNPEIYIQMDLDKLEIKESGATYFSTDSYAKMYPAKIILWVW